MQFDWYFFTVAAPTAILVWLWIFSHFHRIILEFSSFPSNAGWLAWLAVWFMEGDDGGVYMQKHVIIKF